MKRVLTALAVTWLLSQPAAKAHPATDIPEVTLGIKLLEAPVERKNDPRASSYIIDHLPPGAVIHRRLEVENGSRMPLKLRMYPGGGRLSARAGSSTRRTAGATNSPTGSR